MFLEPLVLFSQFYISSNVLNTNLEVGSNIQTNNSNVIFIKQCDFNHVIMIVKGIVLQQKPKLSIAGNG